MNQYEEKEFLQTKTQSQEEYVKSTFWIKLKKHASKIPFVKDAVAMYYCALDPKTPLWAKTVAYGALAYLVLPIDAVPDLIPVGGFVDDGGAIAAAIAALHGYITDEHKKKAEDWLESKM